MKNKLGLLIAGFSVLCFTITAFAHHGFDTEYDANKKVKLTGVVTKIEWLNPHMRVASIVGAPLDVRGIGSSASRRDCTKLATSPGVSQAKGRRPRR